MAHVSGRPGNGRATWLKFGAFVALLAGGALVATLTPVGDLFSREGIGTAVEWLRGSPWAPLIFIGLYAGATALAMPGSILTLAGGAIFGLFWGTVYSSIAANIGANLAFGVARLLGRDGIKRLAGKRLDALDRATENYGFRGLLTLRLIPAVPFNALNFGSGLTAISWPTYAVATAVGIFPGTFVYTMFADALLAGSQEASRQAFLRVLLSGALLVFLSFLPTLARRLGLKLPGSAPAAGAALLIAGSAIGGVSGPRALYAQEIPDHSAFTRLLRDVVHMPRVDYAALKARRGELESYLEQLARTDPAALARAPRDVRLAFWLNAYNACMLRQVVDHYPITRNGGLLTRLKNAVADRPANSVWQIPDVFSRKFCRVAGAERSQDEIEHEIIRPMGEPRIHFAVNCAARSCPPLWPEAYTPEHLDEQLDRAVKNLVSHPEHFAVREEGRRHTVQLNHVLDWYKEDFGGIDGLRTFLARYVDPDTRAVLLDPSTTIAFFDYDWTLNDVER